MVDPVLVEIGPLPIRWYALAYIAGLAFGWLYARRLVADDALWGGTPRPTRESLDDLIVFAAFGIIVGGRLGHVLFYGRDFYFAHPEEIVKTWNGGMAFHGGLIGAIVGMSVFAYREKLSWLSVADIGATVAPIGIFFGRLANFIKPEMWGRPSDLPWAMVFPGAGDVPRHPSQLYEAGLEGLALLLLLAIAARLGALQRPGLSAGLFGVGYGLARIVCEFFREPDASEALEGGLTMGMALSAPMILVGAILVAYALRVRSVAA
jgi:phosphatidylglycerol:prolipoprotein diacylglycerol transferase